MHWKLIFIFNPIPDVAQKKQKHFLKEIWYSNQWSTLRMGKTVQYYSRAVCWVFFFLLIWCVCITIHNFIWRQRGDQITKLKLVFCWSTYNSSCASPKQWAHKYTASLVSSTDEGYSQVNWIIPRLNRWKLRICNICESSNHTSSLYE